jgi:hypothetical protein
VSIARLDSNYASPCSIDSPKNQLLPQRPDCTEGESSLYRRRWRSNSTVQAWCCEGTGDVLSREGIQQRRHHRHRQRQEMGNGSRWRLVGARDWEALETTILQRLDVSALYFSGHYISLVPTYFSLAPAFLRPLHFSGHYVSLASAFLEPLPLSNPYLLRD